MSTSAERAVDAHEVDNNRKTLTDLRAENIDRYYCGAMTHLYNGDSRHAVLWLLSAAMEAADDRRTAAALNALDHAISGFDDDGRLNPEDLVALEDMVDRARQVLGGEELS